MLGVEVGAVEFPRHADLHEAEILGEYRQLHCALPDRDGVACDGVTRRQCRALGRSGGLPQVVALRCVHGGDDFPTPTLATSETLRALSRLVASAPLHLPATIEAARLALEVFQEAAVVLVFETSFSHQLPQRERLCGLDASGRHILQ